MVAAMTAIEAVLNASGPAVEDADVVVAASLPVTVTVGPPALVTALARVCVKPLAPRVDSTLDAMLESTVRTSVILTAVVAAPAVPDNVPLASASQVGKGLDERQAVQFMLAECASELYIARLMLMHIAYKAENKMDIRQENGIAKVFLANMVHKVVDTAIQLHGALGYSRDTPLAAWYTHIRSQRLVDGPDEVHKWTTGRNVIKAFKATGTTAGACGGDML